jgi:hypothetical protein
MNSNGTVVACLCFDWKGKVTDVNILSGPAMMQQSFMESLKDWSFRPGGEEVDASVPAEYCGFTW